MPKQSKVICSKPGNALPVKERPDKYYCCRCTRTFTKQKGNFPASQSPMFKENDGFLPVCRHCVEEMYQHYKFVLDDERAAIRRICLKFDIYWSEQIYDMLNKLSTTQSRVLGYISKSNLRQFEGKTFDDTLDEEDIQLQQLNGTYMVSPIQPDDTSDIDVALDTDTFVLTQDIVDFWGSGLEPAFYRELERRRKYWCGDASEQMDVGELAVIKQICILEATINRDSADGKAIDRNVNALNALLGSANLKPVQKKTESADSVAEATPFGVWIRKIENTRPISEPDPELNDVDGIIKYISVWFLGHLCKMIKVDNKYSRLYEEEMARLRVDRPEYEGEDEESVFEDIFERAAKDDEAEQAGDV